MAQPGLVSGESAKEQPQTAEDLKKAEEAAIETAETIARTKDTYVYTLSTGKKVQCRVAKVGQMGLVLRFLKDVAEKMEVLSTNPDYLTARMKEISDSPMMFLLLMEQAEKYLWPLIVALTSLNDETTARDLDIDDAVGIAKVLFELNKDFFLKRILPMLQGEVSVK